MLLLEIKSQLVLLPYLQQYTLPFCAFQEQQFLSGQHLPLYINQIVAKHHRVVWRKL